MTNKLSSRVRLEEKIKEWRTHGKFRSIISFLFRTRDYFRSVMRGIFFNIIIKKIKTTGPLSDPEEIFHFASRGWFGIISPIQSKYEFVALLRQLQKNTISRVLEIGTANGGTLFMYTRIAEKDATIVSVDLPGGAFGGGYSEKRIPLYKSFALPDQRLELIRADSHLPETLNRVENIFDGNLVDFAFIDGDHTYEGVKSDFEMYSKLIKEGGCVAFHDTIYAEGVKRFWSEISEKYENTWEWISDQDPKYGIGLLQIKR